MYPNWQAGQRVTAALLRAAQPATVVKTVLQAATNTTTLTADNHLVLPVAAGAVYLLDGLIDYDGQFGAGGLKASWSMPAGATLRWGLRGNAPADTGQKFDSNTTLTNDSNNATLSVATYGTGGTHTSARPVGTLIVGGSAGNLTLRWAQNAASATATTVWDGSWLSLRRIS